MPLHKFFYILKTRKSIFLALILLLNTCAFAAPAEVKPLSLDDCINLASKNNETVKIQKKRISQAEHRVSQASGAMLPNVSGIYQRYLRGGASGNGAETDDDAKIYAEETLYNGSILRKTAELSRSEARAAGLELKNAERKLNYDVASAFYALAQSESDYKNTVETLDIMAGRKAELTERVRLGKSRESELYMLESQMAVLLADLQKFSGSRAASLEALSFLIGASSQSITISDSNPEPTTAIPAEAAVKNAFFRSDVESAKENISGQKLRLKIAKGGRMPSVDLNGSWYLDRSGSLSGSKWDVYLILDAPLYQGGIISSKIDEQSSKLDEAEDNLSLARREMEAEIRQLCASLESSIARVAALRDAYAKSRRSYELQLKDYRLGLVNNLDVIQATLTLLSVKSDLDRAVLESKLSKALLDIAVK